MKSGSALVRPDKRCPPKTPHRVAGGYSTSCASEGLTVKTFFDFIGRTEATRGSRRWSWTLIEVNLAML